MPTLKEQKKENQEIEKKIRIALINFTMKTNQACKSKIESEFASEAFEAVSHLVDTILKLKDGYKMGAMYNRTSDYLSYKKFQNECNEGNRYFLSCDSICKLFNDLLEIVEKNDPLRIGNFECKIYSDVKKNVDKILKHSNILEKREDVLVERCRKCLEFILNKKKINEKIEEKMISWLERICNIRFGDKAKWPKNKTEGLAGLAKILIGNKELKFKFQSIINYISKNVNNRSCLWLLVESSKQVDEFLEYLGYIEKRIYQKYELLGKYLNKVHENIESKCGQLKDISSVDFYNDDVIMLESLNRGKESIKNQNFLTKFEVNVPPDHRNFISNFMNMLYCLRGKWFIEQLPKFFFNSCYALDIKIGGESVVTKTVEQLFPEFYKFIDRMKGKKG